MVYYFATVGIIFAFLLIFIVALKTANIGRHAAKAFLVISGLVVVGLACFAAFTMIDSNVAGVGVIGNLMSSFDADPQVWKRNIKSGQFGDLGRNDNDWRLSAGTTGSHFTTLADLHRNARDNIFYATLLVMGTVTIIAGLLFILFNPDRSRSRRRGRGSRRGRSQYVARRGRSRKRGRGRPKRAA